MKIAEIVVVICSVMSLVCACYFAYFSRKLAKQRVRTLTLPKLPIVAIIRKILRQIKEPKSNDTDGTSAVKV